MTKTTEKVEVKAEAAAEQAQGFVAGTREKTAEYFVKGKDIATKGYEFQKANAEAVIEAGKIGFKGAQELAQTNMEYAKTNFAEVQTVVKELTTVKTPTDFVKMQGDIAKKSMEIAMQQASKNTEAFVKLATEMFQPLSNRMAATTDLFKKAA